MPVGSEGNLNVLPFEVSSTDGGVPAVVPLEAVPALTVPLARSLHTYFVPVVAPLGVYVMLPPAEIVVVSRVPVLPNI